MKFIKELKEGDRVFDIYLCKHKQEAVTKNGKPYESVILQDKTGTIDAKVWEPNNPGIGDYDDLDYIEVYGDVTNFQGQRKADPCLPRGRIQSFRLSAGEFQGHRHDV